MIERIWVLSNNATSTGTPICHSWFMLYADGLLGFLLLGLWLFCIFDVITTPEFAVKHLPKLVWLFIVLLLPDIGSVIWLVAGRERSWSTPTRSATNAGRGGAFPEYDRPGRAVAGNPDDDEAFLREVRERAEAQRRSYEARRRAELDAEQSRLRRRPDEG
jgi:hypothetical protein